MEKEVSFNELVERTAETSDKVAGLINGKKITDGLFILSSTTVSIIFQTALDEKEREEYINMFSEMFRSGIVRAEENIDIIQSINKSLST